MATPSTVKYSCGIVLVVFQQPAQPFMALHQVVMLLCAVARDALLATHGGLSLELCAILCHLSPMAVYRLVCSFGHQSLVPVLTRCGLALPRYLLADEKHSRCLTERCICPPRA